MHVSRSFLLAHKRTYRGIKRKDELIWQVVAQILTFSCVTGRAKVMKVKRIMSETGTMMVAK